jgi:hypothetical protein
VTLSFALMFLMPVLPPHGQLLLIGLSAIGFDRSAVQPGRAPESGLASSRRPRAA